MDFLSAIPLTFLADASAASGVMRGYVMPAVATLCVLASLACVFFLINGGIQYMTSSGNPEKLEHAKKIIKHALIGLVLVLGAATLTAILSHAYTSSGTTATEQFPTLQPIETPSDGINVWDVMINAVVGFLRTIVQSIGEPFLNALGYFLNSTPLMGQNASVFNLWLAVVGITDVLFILVIALVGFHVMSFSTFGFDEIDLRQLLPQIALVFLLINTSIFLIDGVISLSNAMIYALQSGFPSTDVWGVLAEITKKSSDMGVAGLLVMMAFLVLSVMLLVYYILRLVTLYIGAILAPLVLLLWLLPAFRDFAITALKTYLTTIFVLFVHVVVLLLAASLLTGVQDGSTNGQPNALMALMVGLATVVALLKTQGFMQELSYAASAPKAARELSGQFIRGVSSMYKTPRSMIKGTQKGYQRAVKLNNFIKTKRGIPIEKPGTKSSASSFNHTGQPQQRPTIIQMKTGETRKAEKPKKKEEK